MSSEFLEPVVLIWSGIILASILILSHLFASVNPYHRFLIPIFAMIVCGYASLHSVSVITGEPIVFSLRSSMSYSIEAMLYLMRAIIAVITMGLLRITLLTNRPVATSS